MKVNRKLFIIVSIIGATMVSACANTNASKFNSSASATSAEADKEWDEEALKMRCAAYVEEFREGQFDRFYEETSDILKAQLPKENLMEQWNTALATARVYDGNQTEQVLIDGEKAEVLVTSVHSRHNIQTSFTFTEEHIVDTLSIGVTPLIVEPESGELWEEYPITVGYDAQKPLNGLLTLPKNVKNPTVAILVQGSGANGMDSLIGASNNRPFADLAHGLAEKGIAVIRYDKRSYTYPKDVVDVETEYLNDVRAAVQLAKKEPRVNGERLYLIGHSQGGMFSPVFAKENPDIKGIVSLGGTLLRLEDKVLAQTQTMMAQSTELTENQKNSELNRVKAEVDRIKRLTPDSNDDKTELLLNYPVSYWISMNAIDTVAIAKELTIPILVLQGGNDFQVTYENDYVYWQQVLDGKENVTFRHYPGLSHVFMPGSRERFDGSSYDPPATMDAQVIGDIANWIHN